MNKIILCWGVLLVYAIFTYCALSNNFGWLKNHPILVLAQMVWFIFTILGGPVFVMLEGFGIPMDEKLVML